MENDLIWAVRMCDSAHMKQVIISSVLLHWNRAVPRICIKLVSKRPVVNATNEPFD